MASRTIGEVRTALAAALTGLTGVNVYAVWPNDPTTIVTPAILIKPTGGRTDGFDGESTYFLELAVLCNPGFSATQQATLDALLSFYGATTASIFRRLWANPRLTNEVETTNLDTFRDYGGHEIGVLDFIGAIIDVEVFVTVG